MRRYDASYSLWPEYASNARARTSFKVIVGAFAAGVIVAISALGVVAEFIKSPTIAAGTRANSVATVVPAVDAPEGQATTGSGGSAHQGRPARGIANNRVVPPVGASVAPDNAVEETRATAPPMREAPPIAQPAVQPAAENLSATTITPELTFAKGYAKRRAARVAQEAANAATPGAGTPGKATDGQSPASEEAKDTPSANGVATEPKKPVKTARAERKRHKPASSSHRVMQAYDLPDGRRIIVYRRYNREMLGTQLSYGDMVSQNYWNGSRRVYMAPQGSLFGGLH